MDTLAHADIFFFVTTIAVVVLGVVFTIALIFLIKILSDIKKITGHVRDETALFREDVRDLRNHMRREDFKVKHFFDFVKKLIGRGKKSSRSK